jgi:hypothetical protein
MEEQYIKGTPPMALLPAKNYVFKINDENYEIRIPRKGNYHDLAPDFFPEDAGEFNILDEESNILYIPSITKVLFATSKYPEMKFNQFFVPYVIKFGTDEVVLVGQVMDMMVTMKSEDTSKIEKEGE